jgi:hypothetical protein
MYRTLLFAALLSSLLVGCDRIRTNSASSGLGANDTNATSPARSDAASTGAPTAPKGFSGSVISTDGTDVACGGGFNGTAMSTDGRRVCAGGKFGGSVISTDGTDVACGGGFDGTAMSTDGRRVCAGGGFEGSARSPS